MKSKSQLVLMVVLGGLVLAIALGVVVHLRSLPLGSADLLRAIASQRGDGVPVDYEKAAELYKKAAAEGNGKAMHNLGFLYWQGWGVPHDPAQALKWFRMGAECGTVRSQEMLGYMYLKGDSVPRDVAKAAYWYQKAAEQGSVDGELQVGLLYYVGDNGVPRDDVKAGKWLTLAAQQGSPAAMNNLGVMCEDSSIPFGTKEQAFDWFTKAAHADYAMAECNLGRIYFQGQIVPRDLVQAYMWLRLGADHGEVTSTHLLTDYLLGKGFTEEQIAQGNKLVQKFRAEHPVPQALSAQNPPGH